MINGWWQGRQRLVGRGMSIGFHFGNDHQWISQRLSHQRLSVCVCVPLFALHIFMVVVYLWNLGHCHRQQTAFHCSYLQTPRSEIFLAVFSASNSICLWIILCGAYCSYFYYIGFQFLHCHRYWLVGNNFLIILITIVIKMLFFLEILFYDLLRFIWNDFFAKKYSK